MAYLKAKQPGLRTSRHRTHLNSREAAREDAGQSGSSHSPLPDPDRPFGRSPVSDNAVILISSPLWAISCIRCIVVGSGSRSFAATLIGPSVSLPCRSSVLPSGSCVIFRSAVSGNGPGVRPGMMPKNSANGSLSHSLTITLRMPSGVVVPEVGKRPPSAHRQSTSPGADGLYARLYTPELGYGPCRIHLDLGLQAERSCQWAHLVQLECSGSADRNAALMVRGF